MLLLLACNQPPAAPIVAITPEEPTTVDDLVAVIQGEASDPNGDDVAYTFAWFVDGAAADVAGDTVPADATLHGEDWKVVVTPSDGKVDGALGEATVTVLDTAPSAALALDPLVPTAGQAVLATAATDDDDAEDTVSVSWSWSRDGVPAGVLDAALPEGVTVRGEAWSVTATPNDGELDGEPISLGFTVANAPPVLSGVTLSPEGATAADTLVATFDGAEDADGDDVTVRVRWLVDGVEVGEEEVAWDGSSSLSGLFGKHQEVTVEATPWDGYDEGATVTSEVLIVADAAPSLTGATISPDPVYVDSVVTCTGDGWADVDGDASGWQTEWTVDGVVVSTDATLPAGTYARGDTIGCTLTPDDGEATGVPVAAAAATVANSPPTCTSAAVAIGPDPATQADTLAITTDGYAGCTDADGDAIAEVYDWQANGVSVGSSDTLAPGSSWRGDSVVLVTAWSDGLDQGARATSNTLVIANAAPEILSVSLTPADVTTDTTLSAVVSASDEEGDAVSLAYAWTVDGVAAGTGSTLDGATAFARDQTVVLTVTPSDGYDAGTPASASVVVGNTAPGAPTVQILPANPGDADALVCGIASAATDADGDSLTYTFAWSIGGVAWTGATTTTFPGDTVPASPTTNGQTWTCSVTATDGTDAGTAGSDDARVGCDADGDGYDASSCGGTDCDDTSVLIHPGASEVCDASDVDEDCDGLSDDDDPSLTGTTYYPDADGDSFGDETAGVTACSRPSGYVSNGDDCDDTRSSVKPGGYEYCDAADRDEDCDGLVEDADPSVSGKSYLYVDADGDGYGAGSYLYACSGVSGYVTNASDCDDTNDTVSPGEDEVCGDGLDNDCDDDSFPCGIEGVGSSYDAAASITGFSYVSGVGVGDFDGDATTDLVVGDSSSSTVHVFYGSLAAGTHTSTDDDVTISGVSGAVGAAGDVDGDGADDFVVVDSSDRAAYIVYGGALADDTLTTADAFDTYDVMNASYAAAGDMDGDGYADFGVGEEYVYRTSYQYHLYLGGASLTEVVLSISWSNGWLTAEGGEDLDGDGLSDLVVNGYSNGYGNAGVYAFMGDAAPAATRLTSSDRWFVADSSVRSAVGCQPGDVNGDGYPDLGVYDESHLYFFLGPPTTGLTTSDAYASTSGVGYGCIHGSDTDDDGVDEMFYRYGDNVYRYPLPLASGTLGSADGQVSFYSTVTGMVPGDPSGDGIDDMTIFSSGTVYLFTGGEW